MANSEAKDNLVKRVVVHPKLYYMVDGVMQHVPQGTVLHLSDDEAKRLEGRVTDPANVKTVVAGETAEGADAVVAALKKQVGLLEKQLSDANTQIEALTKEISAKVKK